MGYQQGRGEEKASITSQSKKENGENGEKESHGQTDAILMHQRGHEDSGNESKALSNKLRGKENKKEGRRDMENLRLHRHPIRLTLLLID